MLNIQITRNIYRNDESSWDVTWFDGPIGAEVKSMEYDNFNQASRKVERLLAGE